MNEQQGPLVLKVKGSSLDDGPGISNGLGCLIIFLGQ